MNSKKILYWSAQLSGWIIYVLMVLISAYVDNPKNLTHLFYLDLLIFIITAVSITHLMRYLFIKKGWLELKLKPLIPRILISSILVSFLILLLANTIKLTFQLNNEELFTPSKLFNSTLSIAVLIFFWNTLYFTFHFFSKSRNEELKNLSLLASKNEFELKNLKNQLNPHFLFNALNSIKALIDIEPAKAKESIYTLSVLLRSTLKIGNENAISIKEEIELVKNYLDLEKIRFEERLTTHFNIEEKTQTFLIPSFTIQMLAENAIKHGISNLINGGEISISTFMKDNSLIIKVENTGAIKTDQNQGIGIKNLERRLEIQYPDKVSFRLQSNDKKVESIIEIKL